MADGAKQSTIFGQPLGLCAIDRISLLLDFLAEPESKHQWLLCVYKCLFDHLYDANRYQQVIGYYFQF